MVDTDARRRRPLRGPWPDWPPAPTSGSPLAGERPRIRGHAPGTTPSPTSSTSTTPPRSAGPPPRPAEPSGAAAPDSLNRSGSRSTHCATRVVRTLRPRERARPLSRDPGAEQRARLPCASGEDGGTDDAQPPGVHSGVVRHGAGTGRAGPRGRPGSLRPDLSRATATTASFAPAAPAAGGTAVVQRRLNALGCNAGPADGVRGQWTRAAITRFQSRLGLRQTGNLTTAQRTRLFGDTAPRCDARPVPARSGAGRRIVISQPQNWVWVVGAGNRVLAQAGIIDNPGELRRGSSAPVPTAVARPGSG